MTEDTEADSEANQSVSSSRPEQASDDQEWTRERWESLASNPEDSADLGYEIADWEQFETLDKTDQVMFLPADEEELKDAAFLVADSANLVDLNEHC